MTTNLDSIDLQDIVMGNESTFEQLGMPVIFREIYKSVHHSIDLLAAMLLEKGWIGLDDDKIWASGEEFEMIRDVVMKYIATCLHLSLCSDWNDVKDRFHQTSDRILADYVCDMDWAE